jgi:ribose 5-phosphate isomerase B
MCFMKIAIASDHTGVALRHELIDEARQLGYEVDDLGPADTTSVDYPVYGELVGRTVAQGRADLGVIICGTGVGISLAANRVAGIRAVVCSEPYSAQLARQHNNANVLAVGARVVGPGLARLILRSWLEATYEGGRHARRVDMLDQISPV